jgi:hypothetical protein
VANVPACVVLLIGGTVFSAERAERTEEREDEAEPLPDQP